MSVTGILSRAILFAAIRDSLAKLSPGVQLRNPATFGVYVGSVFTTILGISMALGATDGTRRAAFRLHIISDFDKYLQY
jgi:potassium-transporting ATPase ATP-binding subunit